MRSSKLFMLVTASIFTLTWLVGLSATTAQAQEVEWERIEGIVQAGNLVGLGLVQPGSGLGSAEGAAPWNTTEGRARVDLGNGDVEFEVEGLVLSVGSAPGFPGLPIGTRGPVNQVKGTLVCNVTGPGNSTLVDTPVVPLSPQGDAEFSGNVALVLDPACVNEPADTAFLIRIAIPGFVGRWIAFGAVRVP